MSYICLVSSIGHRLASKVLEPGQPLYDWGPQITFDLSLQPETFERASVILNEYANVENVQNKFTPDESHPRYGLPDDYFWLKGGDKWALVRAPIRNGDFVFREAEA